MNADSENLARVQIPWRWKDGESMEVTLLPRPLVLITPLVTPGGRAGVSNLTTT